MKTSNIILAAMFVAIVSQGCTKENARIEGIGTITTETLVLDDFSGIRLNGADHVFISHGAQQKVEVTGHPNIISRIKTDVKNNIWDMELERGSYGNYELTYYLTLPYLESAGNNGSGDINITEPLAQPYMEISLLGSGSFRGFSLMAQNCQVDITGSGECEITAEISLDVMINGSGSVYYRGKPSVKDHITGSGRVIDSN